MKKLFVRNILTVCSTGILLTVLVMWSVYTSRLVSPHLNGALLQTVHATMVYVGSICMVASWFFIPQAVFVICTGLIVFAAILFRRRGWIGTARFATVCVMNGISTLLMLGYVLMLVGVFG